MAETELPWEYTLEVMKLKSTDGRRVIAGFASNGSLDGDEEIMDMEALKKASEEYLQGGIVKFMHDKSPLWRGAIGKIIPSYTDSDGVVHKTIFGDKPYLVIEISKSTALDPIWKMIDEGIYRGLSIGGKLLKRTQEFSTEVGKMVNRIHVSRWLETSIVDTPSAKGSFFTVLKGAGMSAKFVEVNEDGEEFMPGDEGALATILTKLDGFEKRLGAIEGKAEVERIEKLEKMVDDQTAMIEVLKRKGGSGGGSGGGKGPGGKGPGGKGKVDTDIQDLVQKELKPIKDALETIQKSPMWKGNKDGDFVEKRGQNTNVGIVEGVLQSTYYGGNK